MADAERKPKEVVVSDLAQVSVPKELGVRGSGEILTLEQAKEEYLRNSTPESMDRFNKAFWTEACRVEGKGREINIPDLPKTVEVDSNVIAPFDPREVSLVDLRNMFPKVISWVTREGTEITDVNDNSGHFLAKMTVDAPYRNTTEGELIQQLNEAGEQQMSLKHYIIFGQMMYVLTGKYPDQGSTWSRLGSCYGGGALHAGFYSVGRLDVRSYLHSGYRIGYLGGRSEKRIKA